MDNAESILRDIVTMATDGDSDHHYSEDFAPLFERAQKLIDISWQTRFVSTDGYLLARIYGRTKEEAEDRATRFAHAIGKPELANFDIQEITITGGLA